MQIPIINGIYTDQSPDFRTSYPVNLIPVPKQNGISNGYLRPADGIVEFAAGTASDRGGINWDGEYYRVMGSRLVRIDSGGTINDLGDVGTNGKQVTFTYSFDYLAIASNKNLFYYDKVNGIQQVTDPDLGTVLDVEWVDGYFMTTDGEFLVVTDLNDPFAVNPLKYGGSEAAPDPIVALVKLRNEIYALNRYTIEVFDNVGTSGFPFARIESAQIERGVIGTHSCCVFMESIAFLGSGQNEAPAIWLANNSSSVKISSREIDQILLELTETQLQSVILETKIDKGHNLLYIHLPDKTMVYDAAGSKEMGMPVWFTLSSGLTTSQYRAKNFVWVYNKWHCADPTSFKLGYLVDNISTHYGDMTGWEFGTMMLYNESNGAIIHELEIVTLTGSVSLDKNPTISTQYSKDGLTWSQEKYIKVGTIGERLKRLVWLQQGNMQSVRVQRFKGTSDAHISIARLDARIEPLNF